MKIFNWLFSSSNKEKKSSNYMQSGATLRDIIVGGSTSATGVEVNHRTAMQASVVCACVDVIARGVSQVPFRLMRKQGRDRFFQAG